MSVRGSNDLRIKIFADGAEKQSLLALYAQPRIKGFTTNPTLMNRAGVTDYEGFARDILAVIKDKPISFEVFSDDFSEMERQAQRIASWGNNVYVKIPITNTERLTSIPLIRRLSSSGIKLNVTAVMTLDQVREAGAALSGETPAIVSVFAGRIADTGRDPMPYMRQAKEIIASYPNVELLWASPRELLNIIQADEVGCHIITVTPDLLKKLDTVGCDLAEFSLDTVKMFYHDGQKAGFRLAVNQNLNYVDTYFGEVQEIIQKIDRTVIQKTIDRLRTLRDRRGRLFILGIGGSAANASHAVNDFRKIAKIEAYAPTDNVAELTAWTNDDSFEVIFQKWLETSRLTSADALLVLSVSGGTATTSRNLVKAMEYARTVGASIIGIVSRDGGMTAKLADLSILVPVVAHDRVTPHAEEWQGIIWHLIVNALA